MPIHRHRTKVMHAKANTRCQCLHLCLPFLQNLSGWRLATSNSLIMVHGRMGSPANCCCLNSQPANCCPSKGPRNSGPSFPCLSKGREKQQKTCSFFGLRHLGVYSVALRAGFYETKDYTLRPSLGFLENETGKGSSSASAPPKLGEAHLWGVF